MKLRIPAPPSFRTRRKAASYYPVPLRFRSTGKWIHQHRHSAVLAAKLLVTAAVCVHLGAAALFPGGSNALLDTQAKSLFAYLTLAPVGDALGFYKTRGKDGFLVYKVFNEAGKVLEGAFPDPGISPRLRYDRWAMFGDHAGKDYPEIHAAFLKYLLERLPATPLKVEIHSARWAWGWQNGAPPSNGGNRGGILVLRKLGSYDGVLKVWSPVKSEPAN